MALGFVILGWIFGVAAAVFALRVGDVGWLAALGIFSLTGSLAAIALLVIAAAREGLLRPQTTFAELEADAHWTDVASDAVWTKAADKPRSKSDRVA